MFSSSHILCEECVNVYVYVYVPLPGLFPQSPSSLPVQGKQGGKQMTMKSLWDFWCLAQTFSPPFSFISGSTFSLLHNHEIILFFCSSPGLFFLLCFFQLAFLPRGFSEPHCQLRKCSHCLRLHSCMQEPSVTPTCLGAHWGGWEEDLRGRQPPSQWALGRQWCLLALRRITGCRQLTLPPFRHLGEAWGECLRQGPLGMPLAKHPFH